MDAAGALDQPLVGGQANSSIVSSPTFLTAAAATWPRWPAGHRPQRCPRMLAGLQGPPDGFPSTAAARVLQLVGDLLVRVTLHGQFDGAGFPALRK